MVYVTDQSRHQVKAWNASSGAVTVVAGSGSAGFAEGTGAAARFNYPTYLALSPTAPVLAVIDSVNQLLRVVSLLSAPLAGGLASAPTLHPFSPWQASYGAVVTLAGTQGVAGYADGVGTAGVLFSTPGGLACDPGGAAWYVTDGGNHRIRRVAASSGVVTTLAGSGAAAWLDGAARAAAFSAPRGLAMHASGSLLALAESGGNRLRTLSCSAGCPVGSWCAGGVAAPCPPGRYGSSSGLSSRMTNWRSCVPSETTVGCASCASCATNSLGVQISVHP
jgi:DNA-binding beta-propeller fold protein YncE